MFEKFTERSRKVMNMARQRAGQLNREFIGTEDILMGIVENSQDGVGVAAKVLKNLDIYLERIRQEVGKLTAPVVAPVVVMGQLPFSLRSKRVIELAAEEAHLLGQDCIGTEHLLLGLLKENDGIAAIVLTNLGLYLNGVRAMVLEVLGGPEKPFGKDTKTRYEVLFATRQGGGGLSTAPTYSLEIAMETAMILKLGGAKSIEIFKITEIPSHTERVMIPLDPSEA